MANEGQRNWGQEVSGILASRKERGLEESEGFLRGHAFRLREEGASLEDVQPLLDKIRANRKELAGIVELLCGKPDPNKPDRRSFTDVY